MKKPARRPTPRTHFVPRVVYRTAFAGVIPLCVASVACGGSVSAANASVGDSGGVSGGDSGDDGTSPVLITGGVGCAGFCAAVGVMAFVDAGGDENTVFVAAIGFDGGRPDSEGGADGARDAPADAAALDAPDETPVFTVACVGFCGGVADAGFGGG